MKPLLIVALGRTISSAPLGRREGDVEVRHVPAHPRAASLPDDRPIAVVLDRALLGGAGGDRVLVEELARVAAVVGMGDPGEQEPGADFPADLLSSWIAGDAPVGAVIAQLRGAFRHAATLVAERTVRAEERKRHAEIGELTRVGVALSTERNLIALLEMILSQARRITSSDAASLYLVERKPDGSPAGTLRFKLSQNYTLPTLPFTEFTVPIDHGSLAGYAAATGEPLVIADVYLLPDNVTYRQNRSFDEKFGYRTKSMLVLPMKTHRDEVIGVLQLINRKRDFDARLATPEQVEEQVLAYETSAVELASALTSSTARWSNDSTSRSTASGLERRASALRLRLMSWRTPMISSRCVFIGITSIDLVR